MATTPTANYGFSKITAGTEKDIWGPIQSATLDAIDTQIKNRQNEAAAKMPLAGGAFTGKVTYPAGGSGAAPMNLPHGVAPSVPVNGDVWSTSAAFFGRVNGTTVQLSTSADLTSGLAGKSNVGHTHAQADVTNLVSDLAGKSATGHTHVMANITDLAAAMALKAPLASPPLTGTPTTPTAAPGTNTTQIASTEFVTAAVVAGGGGLPAATAAEVWAATVTNKAITPAIAAASLNEVAVTYAASLTINFAAGINFAIGTLTGNVTTFAASGIIAAMVGRSGYIKFTQDGTGSRLLTNSAATWKHINGEDIILSTAAGAIDYVFYTILSTTTVFLSVGRNVG